MIEQTLFLEGDLLQCGTIELLRVMELYIFIEFFFIQAYISVKSHWSLGQVAQFIGVLDCALKGCGFNSWSRHIPKLPVQLLVRVRTGGSPSMFLSYINVSLSLSSPHPLFLESIIYPQVRIKKKGKSSLTFIVACYSIV